MVYKILFTHSAEKELTKLPKKDAEAVLAHCLELEAGATRLDVKKLHPPLNGYRMWVGNYRVLYVHETESQITVHAIRHRKNAYQ